MTKKVVVTEEQSPEEGFTDAEIKVGIWNSPPPEKGQGRYLVHGKTIEFGDFAALKAAGQIYYWDEDFLEECDMFTTSPGWRISASGLVILRGKGYDLEIDTIEAQNERAEQAIAQRKIDDAVASAQKQKATADYTNNVVGYESWLGNPVWIDDPDGSKRGTGAQIPLKRIQLEGDERSTEYSLTPSGYIRAHQYINSDWWNTVFSEKPASAHVIEAAEEIKAQKEEKDKKEKEARTEARKHIVYVHLVCPRCGRNVYLNKETANQKKAVRCGKCHTGKKATEATTVEYKNKEEVEYQYIPTGAETI